MHTHTPIVLVTISKLPGVPALAGCEILKRFQLYFSKSGILYLMQSKVQDIQQSQRQEKVAAIK